MAWIRQAPRRQMTDALNESYDDGPRVVAHLNDRWRVIECRDQVQWILPEQFGRLKEANEPPSDIIRVDFVRKTGFER